MSAPTSIQLWMLSSVEKMEEYIALKMEIPKAFIKSYTIAPDVLQMIKDDSYVSVIAADHVFTKLNAAKHDRTTADIEIEGDNVFSSAPLKPLGDHLNFMGLLLDVPTAGMTLEGALNNVRFHYLVPDDDAPAAAAAAASASKTPGAAGSSSSAIDLLDDDEDEDPVPPSKTSAANAKKRKAVQDMINTAVPSDAASVRSDASAANTTRPSVVGSPVVGGKAKLTNQQILGSAQLKATLDVLGNNKRTKVSDAAVFKNEIEKFLWMFKLDVLKTVAGRMDVDKNQNKPDLIDEMAGEICQSAVNKLNNGIF